VLFDTSVFGGGSMKKHTRKNNAGQLLIVAALSIAIIISSTTVYVYELSKETTNSENQSLGSFILALKQSVKSTMLSALVNASSGGDKTILKTDLDSLSQAFRKLHEAETHYISFTFPNDSRYESGIWLSWDADGFGVSSAYASFLLKAYGLTGNMTVESAFNITSSMKLVGSFTGSSGTDKLVSLTCQIFNEGDLASAKNFSVFYEDSGIWKRVDSGNLVTTDYGNGTYSLSFVASTSSMTVPVSVIVRDMRDVLVRANATCSQT
jgi:hypothetical protein